MSQISTKGTVEGGVFANNDLSPNEALATKVIAALVDAGLVSAADGQIILGRLAAGTLDEGSWKLVVENQIERKGGAG
jgi:hypothetical protein